MKERAQGRQWRKLDNTAKIFPVIANENMSNVFRISVVLKEKVDPAVLQEALSETLPCFPGFQVKLHRGFFWYYFETNHKTPVVEKESTYPCRYIDPHGNQMFLFRVSYFERKINLEVFHALTDGLGAASFLREITCRYLQIIQNRQSENTENPISAHIRYRDVEDSYLKNYRRVKKKKYVTRPAFRIPGELLAFGGENVTHVSVSVTALKKAAARYGVSITKFLTAGLIWAVYQEYLKDSETQQRIGINLPINLRTLFDSETMANFFAVTTIDFLAGKKDVKFSEIVELVSRQMDDNIVREKLEETIAYNVSSEKKWYVRIIPLCFKWAALNLIFLKKDGAYTMTLSNIGPLKVPDEYKDRIENFHLMIGVNKRQPFKCGVCAYGDRLTITFASAYEDIRMQKRFFAWLEEEQGDIETEGNGINPEIPAKGLYPHIEYDKNKWKKIVNIFNIVCVAVALILAVVNLAVDPRHLWCLIAIGGIAYAGVTVRYSIMRRSNLGSKILIQTIGAQLLLVLIDYRTGYRGWSVNYAVPSIILFSDLSVIALILVNRLNWQSYLMYQITVTVFSLIPLILWAVGWITNPVMAVITAVLSLLLLAVTILLGDRSVKNELIRRFHL